MTKTRLQPVVDDLSRIFGSRLKAVIAYGWRSEPRQPSLVLAATLTLDDLAACAARTAQWHRAGCATPLLLTSREFERSLDAFPIEYGEILATAQVVVGDHPLQGFSIAPDDMRRACEVQVKSHLLHLRENYLESHARPGRVAALVQESAPAFAALLRHLASLDNAPTDTKGDVIAYFSRRIGLDPRVTGDLLSLADPDVMATVDAGRIFPAYLAAMDRLAEFIDTWK
ncbi:MAG TPA: hypothetical protein VEK56_14145 [Vicinamibacterales bacterium]|nr:hypothetical protein [Vicinamibacterales bacterium]